MVFSAAQEGNVSQCSLNGLLVNEMSPWICLNHTRSSLQVYDSGTIFAPAILDIKPEDLRDKFMAGVANVAALSLAIGYPTVASAPHSIANGFKNLLAIAAATEVEFKEAQTIKEFIKVCIS